MVQESEDNVYSQINKKAPYNPTPRSPGERQHHIDESSLGEFLGHSPHPTADKKPWDPKGVIDETKKKNQFEKRRLAPEKKSAKRKPTRRIPNPPMRSS